MRYTSLTWYEQEDLCPENCFYVSSCLKFDHKDTPVGLTGWYTSS